MKELSQRQKNKIANGYREDEKSRRDKKRTLIAVSASPMLLRYAEDSLKDDEEIVTMAVSSDGSALRFASERIRKMVKVVRVAVSNFAPSYSYALSPAREDGEVISAVIASGMGTIAELPEWARDNKDYALIAIRRNANSIKYFSDRVKSDSEVAITVVKADRTSVRYLGDDVFKDECVFDEVLKIFDFTSKTNVLNNDTPVGFIKAIAERKMRINLASQNFDLMQIDRDILYLLLDIADGSFPKRAELMHKYVALDDRAMVEKMLKRKILPSEGLGGEIKYASSFAKRKVLPLLLMYSQKKTVRTEKSERERLLLRLKRKSLTAVRELKENVAEYIADREVIFSAAKTDGGILFYLNDSPFLADKQLIDLCLSTYVVKNSDHPILKVLSNLTLDKEQAVIACKRDHRNYFFLNKKFQEDEDVAAEAAMFSDEVYNALPEELRTCKKVRDKRWR